MSNERSDLGGLIWETSQRDEGTISVTGADIIADAILAEGWMKPRTIGYVVVDVQTKKLDWDGDLHPSKDAAVASLTGAGQMWCKSVEEEDDERTYWGSAYMICPVELGGPND
jgi:hypothetical protein